MNSLIRSFFCMLMLSLASCTATSDESTGFTTLPEQGWAYGDTVSFIIGPGRPVDRGIVEVSLRHDNNYPYRNVWLEMSYRQDETISRDTVNIELCDLYGRWHGKGFGASYQISGRLPHRLTVDSCLEVNIRHIMRVDTLKGIEMIGIKLSPSHL